MSSCHWEISHFSRYRTFNTFDEIEILEIFYVMINYFKRDLRDHTENITILGPDKPNHADR